jgi:hypothetical protein
MHVVIPMCLPTSDLAWMLSREAEKQQQYDEVLFQNRTWNMMIPQNTAQS